jgi:uncharacterized protein YprB with RNaseH-like and TPR domain/predicted nuclease with RNAse H fold
MLEHSFLHLPRVGLRSEHALWARNILNWDEFEASFHPELPFADNGSLILDALAQGRAALEAEDADYFARLLPRSEHYRIALSFPEQTAFLDIETTGLSAYYHRITVVGLGVGSRYFPWIAGDDPRSLFAALADAKCLVTFNGSLFDLPFLRRHFPGLALPEAHVDLRFLCRRLGLRGGQKAIESELGLSRPSAIASVSGEEAVELWGEYRLGNPRALTKLVRYNRADVDGMRVLFDWALDRLTDSDHGPHLHAAKRRFSRQKAGRFVFEHPAYDGPRYPLVRLPDLTPSRLAGGRDAARGCPNQPSEPRVVGIDPTGSEQKPSGFCLLVGTEAVTSRIGSDEDLLSAVLGARPDIVSIDSPLSLPEGRISVFDDDPGRTKYGILRQCERTLKRRGVNVYPSLIQSMQRMTARSIRLATRLRQSGVPVIESYPGAAQDIMGIVRKRKGLDRLVAGLRAFGVTGSLSPSTSHDELDAITAAIVGRFFLDGRFEALGNEAEDYLIVPDLVPRSDVWASRLVIGISGPIAAGKTTLARHLERQGFTYVRYSQVLENELNAQGVAPDRAGLQRLGEQLNASGKQRWLSSQLFMAAGDSQRIVVDGIRFAEDHAFWSERAGPNFHHIHVASAYDVRRARYERLDPEADFSAISAQPVERQVASLGRLAHLTIENGGRLSDATSRLNELVERISLSAISVDLGA